MDFQRVIVKPVITEESNTLKEMHNRYVFEVDRRANKREIKIAVEHLFNVKVKDVRTTRLRGKMKTNFTRSGRFTGKRPDRKKAYVTLAKDDVIDLFDQV